MFSQSLLARKKLMIPRKPNEFQKGPKHFCLLAFWRPWKLFSLFGTLVEQFSIFWKTFSPFGSHLGLLEAILAFCPLVAILCFWKPSWPVGDNFQLLEAFFSFLWPCLPSRGQFGHFGANSLSMLSLLEPILAFGTYWNLL